MNIKELDEQAGIDDYDFGYMDITKAELDKFAALVAAHKRKECAKMVDHILKEGGGTYGDAIRARSKA